MREEIADGDSRFLASPKLRQIPTHRCVKLQLAPVVENHRGSARGDRLRDGRDVVNGRTCINGGHPEAPIGGPVSLLPDDRAAAPDHDGRAGKPARDHSLLRGAIDQDEAIAVHSDLCRWTTLKYRGVAERDYRRKECEDH